MSKKLLENGFNVICEKPLTTNLEEAKELYSLQKKNNLIFAVTYTYTGYPMVRHMKKLISEGVIGDIQNVDIQYYQGWINSFIHEKEKRKTVWRLDPEKAGISSCIGDIGTHAFNMVEYVTGMEVKELLSDLNMLYEDNSLDTEINPLMGWESSIDTMSEIKLEFYSKEEAINYAKKNNLDYYVIEPEKSA